MEYENGNEGETAAAGENLTESNLNKVTPLSKYLAILLFISMPFLGGWIGYQYAPERVVEVNSVQYEERSAQEETGSIENYVRENGLEGPLAIELGQLEYLIDPWAHIGGVARDNEHVYIIQEAEGGGKLVYKVINVDHLSLELFTQPNFFSSINYFKDVNSVYVLQPLPHKKGYPALTTLSKLQGVDPVSLRVVGVCGSVEKSRGYYLQDANNVLVGLEIIEEADSGTFEFVGEVDANPGGMPTMLGIAKDASNVYVGCKAIVVDGADPETFELVDEFGRARDEIQEYDLVEIGWRK